MVNELDIVIIIRTRKSRPARIQFSIAINQGTSLKVPNIYLDTQPNIESTFCSKIRGFVKISAWLKAPAERYERSQHFNQ